MSRVNSNDGGSNELIPKESKKVNSYEEKTKDEETKVVKEANDKVEEKAEEKNEEKVKEETKENVEKRAEEEVKENVEKGAEEETKERVEEKTKEEEKTEELKIEEEKIEEKSEEETKEKEKTEEIKVEEEKVEEKSNEENSNKKTNEETNDEEIKLKEEALNKSNLDEKENKKKSFITKKRVIISATSLLMLMIVTVATLIFLKYKKINFVDFDKQDYKKETFDIESEEEKNRKADEELKAEEIKFDQIKGNSIYDENIINILLVGDDQKSTDDGHGNSDSILILSIDKKDKKVKVVSLMRDMYVPIAEGYSNNKINAAYGIGGVSLLKKTIEKNFKIPIDGAVVVHFDTFPKLIDKLGGVRATLNKDEANYINGKLKADNIESNLQEGDISLNGDQALWFSRIRKVNSDIYGRDDFGRTSRQRHVLDELFNKYKKMSYFEIYNTVDTVTKIVDIDKDLEGKIPVIAQMVSKFDVEKIENMRLPLDNAYTDTRVFIGSNSVLVLNVSNFMKKNIDELHMFLYGRKNIEDGKNKEDTNIESIDASSNSSVGNNS